MTVAAEAAAVEQSVSEKNLRACLLLCFGSQHHIFQLEVWREYFSQLTLWMPVHLLPISHRDHNLLPLL
jgi:hypothetical protein